MTFGEAILKACIIGDFERDSFTKTQYAAVADQAQKMLAAVTSKIINVYSVTILDGEAVFIMPPDFKRLIRVKAKNSNAVTDYELTGNRLYLKGDGDYDICYEAVPNDINADTSESYIFEIPSYAHFAIPYYIVYQLLKATDTETAQASFNEWNRLMASLDNKPEPSRKLIKNYY